MQSYVTTKKIAGDLKVDPAVITRTAANLRVGISGPHKNSPRTFSPDDAIKIKVAIATDKLGAARNRLAELEAERFQNAVKMSQLAELAAVMGSGAAGPLRDLGEVVARIEAGWKGKARPNIGTPAGKVLFLNSFKNNRADLDRAMAAVVAKI